uniref:Os02g0607100 protein n=1 Tax=Macrostomum lignano TaxID=282301 RepID=A0A1I8FTD8_9PLAT
AAAGALQRPTDDGRSLERALGVRPRARARRRSMMLMGGGGGGGGGGGRRRGGGGTTAARRLTSGPMLDLTHIVPPPPPRRVNEPEKSDCHLEAALGRPGKLTQLSHSLQHVDGGTSGNAINCCYSCFC